MTEIRIKIGRFSKLTQLTRKALKLYEDRGFLIPRYIDEITGYRYYSPDQVHRGLQLSMLAWSGFSLAEMEEILGKLKTQKQEAIQELIATRLSEISKQIERLGQVQEFLGELLVAEKAEDLQLANFNIEERWIPGARCLTYRVKGSYNVVCHRGFTKIFQAIGQTQGAVHPNGPMMLLMHDEEYKEKDADVEVAVPISGQIRPRSPVEFQTLPKSYYACLKHTGPYHMVGPTYMLLLEYIQAHNYQIIGPCREVYLVGPGDAEPDQYLTDIQFPIEAR